jgi:hypothetical protein
MRSKEIIGMKKEALILMAFALNQLKKAFIGLGPAAHYHGNTILRGLGSKLIGTCI